MVTERDPYEGINVDLDSDEIDEGQRPIPDVATNFVVRSAERKRKEGSDFPYVALTVSPETGDPKKDRRKFFVNLSFHPDMLWQTKEFRRGCQMDLRVNARDLLKNPNSDQDYVGHRFSCVPTIKSHPSDPERKINELKNFRQSF